MFKTPPNQEVLTWLGSQLPNGVKDLLSPIKVEKEDPYYVAHIKGQEDQLTDEEFITIFQRYPDLLKKPIVTNGTNVIFGYNEEDLQSVFSEVG